MKRNKEKKRIFFNPNFIQAGNYMLNMSSKWRPLSETQMQAYIV